MTMATIGADQLRRRSVLATGGNDSWELIQRHRDGDREAFGVIFSRYHLEIVRYVYSMMKDLALAQDITSETFTRALAHLDKISYQGKSFRAWLFTIAKNITRDHLKSSEVRRRSDDNEIPDLISSVGDPERMLVLRSLRDELNLRLAELTDAQRECIELRFMRGLSVQETAEHMNKSVGTIKQLQHRAVAALRMLIVVSWSGD